MAYYFSLLTMPGLHRTEQYPAEQFNKRNQQPIRARVGCYMCQACRHKFNRQVSEAEKLIANHAASPKEQKLKKELVNS